MTCYPRFAFPYALRTHLEWHQLEEKDLARGRVEEVLQQVLNRVQLLHQTSVGNIITQDGFT